LCRDFNSSIIIINSHTSSTILADLPHSTLLNNISFVWMVVDEVLLRKLAFTREIERERKGLAKKSQESGH
jgi:hypothetical protein